MVQRVGKLNKLYKYKSKKKRNWKANQTQEPKGIKFVIEKVLNSIQGGEIVWQGFFLLGTERCDGVVGGLCTPCLDYSIPTASLLVSASVHDAQIEFLKFFHYFSFLFGQRLGSHKLAKLMPNYLPPQNAHTSTYSSGKKLLPQRRNALRFMTCPNIVRRSLDRFLRPLCKSWSCGVNVV